MVAEQLTACPACAGSGSLRTGGPTVGTWVDCLSCSGTEAVLAARAVEIREADAELVQCESCWELRDADDMASLGTDTTPPVCDACADDEATRHGAIVGRAS